MKLPQNIKRVKWHSWSGDTSINYTCGYCDSKSAPSTKSIGSTDGTENPNFGVIRICPNCQQPTFFRKEDQLQVPGVRYGTEVSEVPDHIASLYNEARLCMSVNAYTSASMACRKIVLYVACEKGLDHTKNLKFDTAVKYLIDEHHMPSNATVWVDKIRSIGNEANHELVPVSKKKAEMAVEFTHQLLRNVYELVNKANSIDSDDES